VVQTCYNNQVVTVCQSLWPDHKRLPGYSLR
jgi:hypothetical protein